MRHRKIFTNKLYPLHLNFQGTFLLNDDYIKQKIYLITQLKVKLIRRNLMQASYFMLNKNKFSVIKQNNFKM